MTDVDDLLQKTSRTFAVTIPMLPSPTRQQVGLAYLLFRIVDTFEDGTHWAPARRVEMIESFTQLLEANDPEGVRRLSERCLADPPVRHAGYLELLHEMPFVMRKLDEMPADAREILCNHVRRSGEGMAQIVSRCDDGGRLSLTTLQDLRDYCYIVAGIVGEMLTELFLLGRPQLSGVSEYLRQRAHLFGEGLQLVNILKDSDADAREGRIYLPSDTERAQVMALARADLRSSSDYTLALQEQGAERGLVIFNALLVRLALGTLAALREQRPSGKLSRVEVYSIVSSVLRDVDNGQPVFPIAGSGADLPATA